MTETDSRKASEHMCMLAPSWLLKARSKKSNHGRMTCLHNHENMKKFQCVNSVLKYPPNEELNDKNVWDS